MKDCIEYQIVNHSVRRELTCKVWVLGLTVNVDEMVESQLGCFQIEGQVKYLYHGRFLE